MGMRPGKYWWLGVLIFVGTGVSVWDYKNWRYEETKNYGHGPEFVKPLELTKQYQNKIAGLRMRYPAGWEVYVDAKFKMQDARFNLTDLVKIGERVEVAMIGEVTIGVERINKNFPDVVNAEVAELPVKLARERDYIVVSTADMVVLTWEEGEVVYQRALASGRGKIVVTDVSKSKSEWKNLEKTFWEMYKSLVLI